MALSGLLLGGVRPHDGFLLFPLSAVLLGLATDVWSGFYIPVSAMMNDVYTRKRLE